MRRCWTTSRTLWRVLKSSAPCTSFLFRCFYGYHECDIRRRTLALDTMADVSVHGESGSRQGGMVVAAETRSFYSTLS